MQFIALLLTAIALVPGDAHAASALSKLGMSQSDYFVAQMAYNGWALFGVAQIAALGVNIALAVASRGKAMPFRLTAATVVCLVAGLAIFFAFTYPANVATQNWTVAPADWQALRWRWEISHAVNAALTLIGFGTLCLATLTMPRA
ncbi:MAG: hypothetical protein JSR72_15270 [Proteobacteria bacterium]|nr:hypothetical protein [Pseudomonadota bacterium]